MKSTYGYSKGNTSIGSTTYYISPTAQDPSVSSDAFVADVLVDKAGTSLTYVNTIVEGVVPKQILSYGGYVKDGAKFILKNAYFQNISGFRAQNGHVIMNGGKIEGVVQVVCAEGK
ncbi:hypothetical protein, partial [Bartonella sp. CL32QHWL-2]|uniref:hypothetical protein n=1 Tax=Bartonella sp. CL32QHWL-2 TaxID=3243525 RepID=UPI0035CECBA8